ncbi:MAG TPA: DUF5930 domain-containing protein [Thermohalobaculum sp.]|nr:DUF5930 domain-containing protein [Thermohalobaculum sp.]
MQSRPSSPVRQAFATVLPKRRVSIWTERRTRHFTLSPAAQIVGVLLVAALIGWSGFATSAYLGGALDGDRPEARIDTMRTAYEAKLAGLAARQQGLEQVLAEADSRRDAVTERLSDKQARLIESQARLQEADATLSALRERVAALTGARHEDAARIARLEAELAGLRLAFADAETERANLDSAVDHFSTAMEQVIAERDSAGTVTERLRAQVTGLAGSLGNLKDRQNLLIARIENAARTSFAGLESLFTRSNLDLERILAEARREYSGAGGPFVPIAEGEAMALASAGDTRVAALMQELETVNLMRYAADRLPFGQPVNSGRLTSSFGPRNDPHGRGHAMHEGIDFAGPRGTPILATADGIVTFAGRQRGYGNLVQIRHAFGFETLYAHLHRARVKVGQRIARGDRIGDMGNTGRSTGTHVHYEIRIDKKAVNPLKFIEAARDVL